MADGHVHAAHVGAAVFENRGEIRAVDFQPVERHRRDAHADFAVPGARLFRLAGEVQREPRERAEFHGQLRHLEVGERAVDGHARGLDGQGGVVTLGEVLALLVELAAGQHERGGAAKGVEFELHAALVLRALRGVEIHLVETQLRRELEVADVEVPRLVAGLGGEVFPQRHAGNLQPRHAQRAGLLRIEEQMKPANDGDVFFRAHREVEVLDFHAVRVERGLAEDGVEQRADALALAAHVRFFLLLFAGQRVDLQVGIRDLVAAEEFAEAVLEQPRNTVVEPHAVDGEAVDGIRKIAHRIGADAGDGEIGEDVAAEMEIHFQVHARSHRDERQARAAEDERAVKNGGDEPEHEQPAQGATEPAAFRLGFRRCERWGSRGLRHGRHRLAAALSHARRREVACAEISPLKSAR